VRILITGASGLLGGRLSLLLSSDHQIVGLTRSRPAPEGISSVSADLNDGAAVAAALEQARPDAVVHCAALADAEVCEREPERAFRENLAATTQLAGACRSRGTRLVAISTDLVFEGGQAFSSETSEARPLTVYGRSKLAAEEVTLRTSPDSVVLRVALVNGLGHGPRLTASESVARQLRKGEPITLYEDEWRTPVDPESVAQALRAVLRRREAGGRFHIAGAERLSRTGLGEIVARAFGLDASLILRAPQSSHRGAPRPADVSLGITRAREELGFSPRSLEAAVREGRLA
jgi:dTDP-4-dehydrorhamnose reductase